VKLSVPESGPGRFAFFFITQMVSYFALVANARAFNQALYTYTALTDGFIAAQQFILVRLIAKDENSGGPWSFAGTVMGGVTGSLMSIWVTQHLYGH
jgi:hypothetical protein